jgi:hypothetical protein
MRSQHSATTVLAIGFFSLTAQAANAAGPTGIGGLKLGMTKAQIEALKGDVQLSSGLTDWKPSNSVDYTPKPGKVRLEGMLDNPVSGKGKVTLTFTKGKLTQIFLKLDDRSDFVTAKNLISSKYGSPKVDNRQKDEQCIYRNGNSFSLKNGKAMYQWRQQQGDLLVSTEIYELLVNICPSNLRYGTTGGIAVRWLSIGYASKQSAQASPF